MNFNPVEAELLDLINPVRRAEVGIPGQWRSYPLNPVLSFQSVRHSQSLSHENDVSGENKFLVFHLFLLPET